MYFGSHELSDLLEKLGKTHEEAEEILEKVIPTPSHYRLQLSLNDEQERHARKCLRSRGKPRRRNMEQLTAPAGVSLKSILVATDFSKFPGHGGDY